MSLQTVIIASGNDGKLKEFEQLFSASQLTIMPQSDFSVPEAIEDGLSFIENAIIKARNAAKHTGIAAIADDSGLEVDALNGAPGIYSARFGEDENGMRAGDEANNSKLLRLLEGKPASERIARFVCALAFMRHETDPSPMVCVARWQGVILTEPRGEHGFGYDPLFFLPEYNCASAELDPAVKNSISHRGQALKMLFEQMDSVGLLP